MIKKENLVGVIKDLHNVFHPNWMLFESLLEKEVIAGDTSENKHPSWRKATYVQSFTVDERRRNVIPRRVIYHWHHERKLLCAHFEVESGRFFLDISFHVDEYNIDPEINIRIKDERYYSELCRAPDTTSKPLKNIEWLRMMLSPQTYQKVEEACVARDSGELGEYVTRYGRIRVKTLFV